MSPTSSAGRDLPRCRLIRRGAAGRAVAAVVKHGAEPYDRRHHLPRLLPVAPGELVDEGIAARRQIVTRLARALRAERNRGRAGHWTYDLNRHIGLAQAYAAERAGLQSAQTKPWEKVDLR